MSRAYQFQSTRWSIVLQAGHDSSPLCRAALDSLCQMYWYPIYAYVRRCGHDEHQAQDLTQEFLTRLIERGSISLADPQRGRFRSFLITALKNFLSDERAKAMTQKRGGHLKTFSIDCATGESRYLREPNHILTAERLYEKTWALEVINSALTSLREEYDRTERLEQFELLKTFLTGPPHKGAYSQVAEKLGKSEGSVVAAASRLRRRYRELLHDEVLQTVTQPQDVADEIQALFASLSKS